MTDRPIDHCYWVDPGKLLAGEYPRDFGDESSAAKMARLTGAGVSVFIDLTEPGELKPYTEWLRGALHCRFPIVDGRVPASPDQTTQILDAIDRHISEGHTVYVHCMGGIGRTGTIIGCWLTRQGLSGEAALARLDELWQQCPKSRWTRSPETGQQAWYVRDWTEPA